LNLFSIFINIYMSNLKDILLRTAEIFDAWRIIPRIVLALYASLVFSLYLWYRSIPTYVQEKCDNSLLDSLLTQGFELDKAQSVACTVIDIVGGPTMAQSTFVTTIIGLSTGIFGLYVATGRKWDKFGYYDRFPHPSFPSDDGRGWWGRRRPPYGPNPHYGPHYGPYGPQPYGPYSEDHGEDQRPLDGVSEDQGELPEVEFKPSPNGPKWENPFADDEGNNGPRNPDYEVK
jgi:hypothetical protein